MLVLAGPVLMVGGLLLSLASGALFPLPVYVAAFLTLAAVPSGLVVAVLALSRNSRTVSDTGTVTRREAPTGVPFRVDFGRSLARSGEGKN